MRAFSRLARITNALKLDRPLVRHAHAAGAAGAPAVPPVEQILHLDRINPNVIQAEYAVRGRLVLKAEELAKKLKQPNHGLPFNEIIFCNIGNPQALLQKPLTFFRQVLSLALSPQLLEPQHIETTKKLYPADAIARAHTMLKQTPGGFGAYSHSKGLPFIRENVAKFIQDRDGYPSDPENIFLSNGASEGIAHVLRMIVRDRNDGVLTPIPQYPLYSATLALIGGRQLGYYLDEAKEWGCSLPALNAALAEAKAKNIVPRAMVVINPGNPTGQVLTEQNMVEIIHFCQQNRLVLLADEVYQANIYTQKSFHSFKKVLRSLPQEQFGSFELFSFHSTSKGFLGECGLRGGYTELTNIRDDIRDQLYKLWSISLCSNVVGQLTVDLMTAPPKPGDPSYELYSKERDAICASLQRRAQRLSAALNELQGVSCNRAEGAMYLFPRITLSRNVAEAAKKLKITPDTYYAEQLLENAGICVVPGSGFGQEDGTWHFRTTFLPQEDKMEQVIEKMRQFHGKFMAKHS